VSRRKVIIDGQAVDFTVVQPDATKLKATVAPSGDMARKAYYDRNAINKLITCSWHGTVAAGQTWLEVWAYTVPTGKKAMMTLTFLRIDGAIATSGRFAAATTSLLPAGESSVEIVGQFHWTTDPYKIDTWTAIAVAMPGDKFHGWVRNTDTASHFMALRNAIVEFDA